MTRTDYYVYLLLRQPISKLPTADRYDPKNVLYVGKGKGYRWRQHFKEANVSDSKKSNAIAKILGPKPSAGLIERHALVVAGDLTEREAFRLESIMLHLVGGPGAVTNVVRGRAAGQILVPAQHARVFFGAEDIEVKSYRARGGRLPQSDLLKPRPEGSLMFMVKGTADRLSEPGYQRTDKDGRFSRSKAMSAIPREAPIVRRGWDPQTPWSPDEAWARAQRFWSGSVQSIETWQKAIDARGGYLALLVPDPRDGRSVIRYVWKLKASGTWEDYGDRFGFPRGELVENHPWLGKRPVDRDSKRGILCSPNAPAVTTWVGRQPRGQIESQS